MMEEVVRKFGAAMLETRGQEISPIQLKAMAAISGCRTGRFGGMIVKCDTCGTTEWRNHSCGNRLCPLCQNHESSRWVQRQSEKLLPTAYFMVTFTVPFSLRDLIRRNQQIGLDGLFKASAEALTELAEDPVRMGGRIGMTGVLHTHSRQLDFHPHIHYILPGGCVDRVKRVWRQRKPEFLFPVKALGILYREKFLSHLRYNGIAYPGNLHRASWVVHIQPAGKGLPAIKYLSQYLYRGVLSERSIEMLANGRVRFSYIDSTTGHRAYKTLKGEEFLFLYLQHVLPKGFRRVREFGFHHGKCKQTLLLIRLILKGREPMDAIVLFRPAFRCSCCGEPMRVIIAGIRPRNFHYP